MRALIVPAVMLLVSGCSLVGAEGTPGQMQEAAAVHAFVGSIGTYGQRLAAANALYQPGVYGLHPSFGR